jgi:hypothetical protein
MTDVVCVFCVFFVCFLCVFFKVLVGLFDGLVVMPLILIISFGLI